MRFEAVVFDLDGTLLDTIDDLADAMNAVLTARGLPPHSAARYCYLVGDGIHNLARRALPDELADDAALVTAVVAEMRDEYGQRWDRRTRPYPGIAAMLDALTAAGRRLTVLSNKPDAVTRQVVDRLLANWRFEVVLGARDHVPIKPDPAGAQEVAERLGVAPAACCYLGDTATDMHTARAAGMPAVGAEWGFRTRRELVEAGAWQVIAQPSELLPLVLAGPPLEETR